MCENEQGAGNQKAATGGASYPLGQQGQGQGPVGEGMMSQGLAQGQAGGEQGQGMAAPAGYPQGMPPGYAGAAQGQGPGIAPPAYGAPAQPQGGPAGYPPMHPAYLQPGQMPPGAYPAPGYPATHYQMPYGAPAYGMPPAAPRMHAPQAGMQPAQGMHAGQGRQAGMSDLMEEIANGGNGLSSLGKMLNLDDTELWKGALIGAAAVLLLTNESVQGMLFKTGAKAKQAARTGVDKLEGAASAVTDKAES